MDFPEVARLLSASNQTGVLQVMEQSLVGELYFQLGNLIHAEAGDVTGLDALVTIGMRQSAHFSFDPSVLEAPGRSLVEYPTARLLENLKSQLHEFNQEKIALPAPTDVLRYTHGKELLSVQATPEELALLLLADGKRTVEEIALEARQDYQKVSATLAKLRSAGILETLSLATNPTPPPDVELEPRQEPIYWRGKRVG